MLGMSNLVVEFLLWYIDELVYTFVIIGLSIVVVCTCLSILLLSDFCMNT
jgi:hypothetical protein